ncbi:MAG: ROK family protein [Candidatus Promineofilum sp.]|nr:ROK family protein [Promineifilum sp.]
MKLRVGLDVGGTKTAALIVDEAGRPLGRAVRPTQSDSPPSLVSGIRATIDQALHDADQSLESLVAAGVGIPGQVDPTNGTVRLAVNLNLTDPYPLRDILQETLGIPVALENDVRAAAWGAYHWAGQQAPLNSLAYLSIGTGISAGLILDGHLYRGAHGMAGEIGHIPFEVTGPRCVCGSYGCLEAFAAGPAIAASAATLADAGHNLTTDEVYALAAAGHPAATQIVERAAGYLARAVYLLVMTYDVEKVVLGGGVTRAADAFEQPLRRALDTLRAASSLASSMMPDEKVVIIPPDYNAGVMGAVFLAPAPMPADRQEENEKSTESASPIAVKQ